MRYGPFCGVEFMNIALGRPFATMMGFTRDEIMLVFNTQLETLGRKKQQTQDSQLNELQE